MIEWLYRPYNLFIIFILVKIFTTLFHQQGMNLFWFMYQNLRHIKILSRISSKKLMALDPEWLVSVGMSLVWREICAQQWRTQWKIINQSHIWESCPNFHCKNTTVSLLLCLSCAYVCVCLVLLVQILIHNSRSTKLNISVLFDLTWFYQCANSVVCTLRL